MNQLPPLAQGAIDAFYTSGRANPAKVPKEWVMGVIKQESGGVPYFTGAEQLFKWNLEAAHKITGLPIDQLKTGLIIPAGVGAFNTPPEMAGKFLKFRCEPGSLYWGWSRRLTGFGPTEKFLLACSLGMGQQMVRYLTPGLERQFWTGRILRFGCDPGQQVEWVHGNLRDEVKRGTIDPVLVFARYNGGPGMQNDRHGYGAKVLAYVNQFLQKEHM